MERKKPKSLRVGRFGRAALLLGVATATAGVMVLSAGAAHAAVGKDPGAVALTPGSGPVSTTATWATSQGCASGFQGSAVFKIEESNGSTFNISAGTNSVVAPFSGTLQGPISQIATSLPPGIPNGGTAELVVFCYSGASQTGTSDPEMSTFLTISADGTTYSTSATGPSGPANTTTTLTASPSTAQVGATVTLTATVTAANSTIPAGSVQFESGGTAIGSPVAVNASGVATTTTTFSAAGTDALSAVFTPTSTTSYNSSTGTFSETVTTTNPNSGTEPLSVTVPSAGTFSLTVATGTVNLSVSGATATGALNPITVTDSRNTFPGWSVSGQTSDFTGSGSAAGGTISGNQLGWVPTDTSLATGATLGGTVAPGGPGLGSTAAVLASANPGGGVGTSALSANLTLDIPSSAIAGPYAATMTITAVTTGP